MTDDIVVTLPTGVMVDTLITAVASVDGAEVETTKTTHEAPPLLDEDAEAIAAWLTGANEPETTPPEGR